MPTTPCPMCGSEAPVDAAACGVCGFRLHEVGSTNRGGSKCARCGSGVPAGFDFCPVCGQDQRARHARPVTEMMHIEQGQGPPPASHDGSAHQAAMPPAEHNRTVFAEHVPHPPVIEAAGPTGSSAALPHHGPAMPQAGAMHPEERLATVPEDGLPHSTLGGAEPSRAAVAPPQWGHPASQGATRARVVVIRRDGSEGESFPIAGHELVFGRSHAMVTFPDDIFMSPTHARVERTAHGFNLIDVGSRNGVFLRIRKTASVYPGDLFMVGHQLLRLESVAHTLHESPPTADGTQEFGTPLQPAWGRLVLLGRGGIAGDVYHLRSAEVVFGREAGDIIFPGDAFVSRQHARLRLEIENTSMTVYLDDLDSANGTYIRVRGSVEVGAEDTFRVGDQILRLRLDP